MTDTLKPCPFCGGTPKRHKENLGDTLAATVVQLNDTQAELDAEIKRVAELEQECEEYEQQMSAGRALYLKSVESLAAARAEIEQLKKDRDLTWEAFAKVNDVVKQAVHMIGEEALRSTYRRNGLAPEETNNG
jgi:hypothetical protein